MTVQISAFRWVPPFAQGYVKDLRVRWALEEADLAYEVVLIDPVIQASPAYRAWQPFGQVPAFREDELEIFESGAIVLHLATKKWWTSRQSLTTTRHNPVAKEHSYRGIASPTARSACSMASMTARMRGIWRMS